MHCFIPVLLFPSYQQLIYISALCLIMIISIFLLVCNMYQYQSIEMFRRKMLILLNWTRTKESSKVNKKAQETMHLTLPSSSSSSTLSREDKKREEKGIWSNSSVSLARGEIGKRKRSGGKTSFLLPSSYSFQGGTWTIFQQARGNNNNAHKNTNRTYNNLPKHGWHHYSYFFRECTMLCVQNDFINNVITTIIAIDDEFFFEKSCSSILLCKHKIQKIVTEGKERRKYIWIFFYWWCKNKKIYNVNVTTFLHVHQKIFNNQNERLNTSWLMVPMIIISYCYWYRRRGWRCIWISRSKEDKCVSIHPAGIACLLEQKWGNVSNFGNYCLIFIFLRWCLSYHITSSQLI